MGFLRVPYLQEFSSAIPLSPKPSGNSVVRRFSPYKKRSEKEKEKGKEKGKEKEKGSAMDQTE